MEYPQRKPIRLEGYDYSTAGAYFITICAESRKPLFCTPDHLPTAVGRFIHLAISQIPMHYPNVSVDVYSIMPDHLHMILRINESEDNSASLSQIIGHMKRWVSKQSGRSVWQKSFYERVIRNTKDYQETWTYIEQNPLKADFIRCGIL